MKTTSALAIAAAAGLFLAASPAKAADLGGDCCADLAERVAELEATTVRKGNKKVSVTLYGQVNRALLFWDDGVDSDVYVVDNDVSSTRLGVRGDASFGGEYKMGYNIEIEFQDTASNNVSQINDDGGEIQPDIRMANVYIASERWGKFTLGQQSFATDGITEIDLSGTGVVSGFGTNNAWVQSFRVRLSDGSFARDAFPVAANFWTWGNFITELDGTRRDGIRWDSPTLHGFSLSAAWGEDDLADVALRFAREFANTGIRLAAGIGYQWGYENDGGDSDVNDGGVPVNSNDSETIMGSVSVLHVPTGLNLTFAAGELDNDVANGDQSFWALKAGLTRKVFSIGATSIYGEYYEGKTDFDANLDAVDALGVLIEENIGVNYWGFGLVQNIDDAATELYIAYRHYELDFTDNNILPPPVSVEDLSTVVAGARIRF